MAQHLRPRAKTIDQPGNLSPLLFGGSFQQLLQLTPCAVEMAVLSFHLRTLRGQQLHRRRLLAQHPHHIEAHNIAGAFPDAVDRHLTVEAREFALLAIADAAQHFHHLGDKRDTGLTDGKLGRRRKQARPGAFPGIIPTVPGPRQAKQKRGLPLQTERHLPQQLAHHRLFDQVFAKRLTL